MGTTTITLTQPYDSMSVTVKATVTARSGQGGQGMGDQTFTVEIQDGSSNKVDFVGTAEMLHNLARDITQAIKP